MRDAWAYAARYGKQSLEVLERMSIFELLDFTKRISAIVAEENRPRED